MVVITCSTFQVMGSPQYPSLYGYRDSTSEEYASIRSTSGSRFPSYVPQEDHHHQDYQSLYVQLLALDTTPVTPPSQNQKEKSGGSRRGGGEGTQNQQKRSSKPQHQQRAPSRTSSSTSVATVTPMERAVELTSLLECPVCCYIPEGEVFNCERGHSVCGECHKKLPKCAFCASPSTGGSRNFMAESLIAFFKKHSVPLEGKPGLNPLIASCEHKREGCKVTALKSKVQDHCRSCDFRPIPCTLFRENCGFHPKFKLSEYFEHLKSFHKITGQSDKDNRVSGHFTKIDRLFKGIDITTTWPPFYLEYDGKVFVRHASILNRNIYWWIQLIGPDGDAKKYLATISLESPVKTLKISWTLPVHPIRSGLQEIVRSKEIASITTSKLLQFCTFDQPFEDRNSTHVWSFNICLSKVV